MENKKNLLQVDLKELEDNYGGCIMLYRNNKASEWKLIFKGQTAWREMALRLEAKYISHCKWITRVRRTTDYSGVEKIYLSEDNGGCCLFIKKAR